METRDLTTMAIEILDQAALQLVASDAVIDCVATGFIFTEGALWHSEQAHLLFSDIIGDQMHRWDAEHGLVSFRQPSHMANGNTWDRQGRLLTCEHATSRVTRTETDGSITVLASHVEGRELNSRTTSSSRATERSTLPIRSSADARRTACRATRSSITAACIGSTLAMAG